MKAIIYLLIIPLFIIACSNEKKTDEEKMAEKKMGISLVKFDKDKVNYVEVLFNPNLTFPKATFISISDDSLSLLNKIIIDLKLEKKTKEITDSINGEKILNPYLENGLWSMSSDEIKSEIDAIEWWLPNLQTTIDNYAAFYYGDTLRPLTTLDIKEKWNGKIVAQINKNKLFILIEERQNSISIDYMRQRFPH